MVEIVLKKIEDGHKDQGSLENVESYLNVIPRCWASAERNIPI